MHAGPEGSVLSDWSQTASVEAVALVVETLEVFENLAVRLATAMAFEQQIGPVVGQNVLAAAGSVRCPLWRDRSRRFAIVASGSLRAGRANASPIRVVVQMRSLGLPGRRNLTSSTNRFPSWLRCQPPSFPAVAVTSGTKRQTSRFAGGIAKHDGAGRCQPLSVFIYRRLRLPPEPKATAGPAARIRSAQAISSCGRAGGFGWSGNEMAGNEMAFPFSVAPPYACR